MTNKRRFRPGFDVPVRYKGKSNTDRKVEIVIKGQADLEADKKPSHTGWAKSHRRIISKAWRNRLAHG